MVSINKNVSLDLSATLLLFVLLDRLSYVFLWVWLNKILPI